MYFLEDVRWTLIAVRVPVELEGSDSRIPPTRAIATERSEPVAGRAKSRADKFSMPLMNGDI
jgi:hypothetical protein